MKRFFTWVAVAFLVAVAVARWRRVKELGRRVPSGGREKPVATEQADGPKSGVQATPAAERKAEELDVDLESVEGSGAEGRVVVEDVEEAAEEEGKVHATEAAERKAQELGVDLATVEGTGKGGRITVKDVQSAAKDR